MEPRLHLAPCDLLIYIGILRWHGRQYELACGIPWCHLSGGIARGVKGEWGGGVRVDSEGPAKATRSNDPLVSCRPLGYAMSWDL